MDLSAARGYVAPFFRQNENYSQLKSISRGGDRVTRYEKMNLTRGPTDHDNLLFRALD